MAREKLVGGMMIWKMVIQEHVWDCELGASASGWRLEGPGFRYGPVIFPASLPSCQNVTSHEGKTPSTSFPIHSQGNPPFLSALCRLLCAELTQYLHKLTRTGLSNGKDRTWCQWRDIAYCAVRWSCCTLGSGMWCRVLGQVGIDFSEVPPAFIFSSEGVASWFVWNIGTYLPTYTASHSRIPLFNTLSQSDLLYLPTSGVEGYCCTWSH
jgi:hypothetical protein